MFRILCEYIPLYVKTVYLVRNKFPFGIELAPTSVIFRCDIIRQVMIEDKAEKTVKEGEINLLIYLYLYYCTYGLQLKTSIAGCLRHTCFWIYISTLTGKEDFVQNFLTNVTISTYQTSIFFSCAVKLRMPQLIVFMFITFIHYSRTCAKCNIFWQNIQFDT